MVTLRDILAGVLEGRLELAAIMRPPVFIPEFARVSRLLREFQRTRQYLAFVVDEYGIVQGLVTLEDVIEEIVGSIREAGRAGGAALRHAGWMTARISSTARRPSGSCGSGWACRSRIAPEYTTLAGFVLSALGSVPQPGASFAAGGYTWTVVDMSGPRIEKVKVAPAGSKGGRGEPAGELTPSSSSATRGAMASARARTSAGVRLPTGCGITAEG